MRVCLKCGSTMRANKDTKKPPYCPNGCSQVTAVPLGDGYSVRANSSTGVIITSASGVYRRTPNIFE